MYKRPARILFLSRTDACRGLMAEAAARVDGAGWLEARSAGLDPGAGPDPEALAALARAGLGGMDLRPKALTREDLEWADLVVSLDAAAGRRAGELAPGRPHRHWELPAPGAVGAAALLAEIRDRVAKMVGGMRMLARLDDGRGPKPPGWTPP